MSFLPDSLKNMFSDRNLTILAIASVAAAGITYSFYRYTEPNDQNTANPDPKQTGSPQPIPESSEPKEEAIGDEEESKGESIDMLSLDKDRDLCKTKAAQVTRALTQMEITGQ